MPYNFLEVFFVNILILSGSPRKNSNSAAFANEFKKGAESIGHTVTLFDVGNMKIGACLACEYCHNKGNGECIQKDGMQSIYPALNTADVIVFASAVHYWSFSGQLQSVITRFYAPHKPTAKKYAMILSSHSPDVYNALISQYTDMLDFFGAENLGIKTFCGTNQLTENNLKEIYDFGASL